MYYQISLPLKTAKEYASQIFHSFDTPVKIIEVNDWGAIYTKYPIPPEGSSNEAQSKTVMKEYSHAKNSSTKRSKISGS